MWKEELWTLATFRRISFRVGIGSFWSSELIGNRTSRGTSAAQLGWPVTRSLTLCTERNPLLSLCLTIMLRKSLSTCLLSLAPLSSWLNTNNPQIDWSKSCISGWSLWCYEICLHSATPCVSPSVPTNQAAAPNLSTVPVIYHDLATVFSKHLSLISSASFPLWLHHRLVPRGLHPGPGFPLRLRTSHSIPFNTFNTHLGHIKYLVMPFRLTNAPAVFQALFNNVLKDFINHVVFVYLDDILIFSKDMTEHKNTSFMLKMRSVNSTFPEAPF